LRVFSSFVFPFLPAVRFLLAGLSPSGSLVLNRGHQRDSSHSSPIFCVFPFFLCTLSPHESVYKTPSFPFHHGAPLFSFAVRVLTSHLSPCYRRFLVLGMNLAVFCPDPSVPGRSPLSPVTPPSISGLTARLHEPDFPFFFLFLPGHAHSTPLVFQKKTFPIFLVLSVPFFAPSKKRSFFAMSAATSCSLVY